MGSQAQRIGAELRQAVSSVIRMLALEIDAELRKATPVDTGHARRNWIASVGQPNTQEAKDDAARAEGIQAVLSYDLASGALWVSNVVPYIRSLNYGHSKQAPAGFVERAVDIAMQRVQQKVASKGIDISKLRSEFQSAVGGEMAGNVASAYSPLSGGDE
jgi:hypothetical protein